MVTVSLGPLGIPVACQVPSQPLRSPLPSFQYINAVPGNDTAGGHCPSYTHLYNTPSTPWTPQPCSFPLSHGRRGSLTDWPPLLGFQGVPCSHHVLPGITWPLQHPWIPLFVWVLQDPLSSLGISKVLKAPQDPSSLSIPSIIAAAAASPATPASSKTAATVPRAGNP